MDIDTFAREFKGNWRHFSDFAWHTQYDLDDPEEFGIYYYGTRDDDTLSQSNAATIETLMGVFSEEDCWLESHGHWAVGHVECVVVRVYVADTYPPEYTPAFQELYRITEALAEYPVLDEDDWSNREYESQIESIRDACWQLDTTNWPEGWAYEVYRAMDDRYIEGDSVDYAAAEQTARQLYAEYLVEEV